MKVECNLEKLREAAILAEKMTGKNLMLPVLHSLLIEAKGKSLIFRATNLSVGIEIEIPATVHREGVAAVDGAVFAQVCSNITTPKPVVLSQDHENLLVESLKSKSIVKCVPVEEFPTLPGVEGESFTIKKSVLQEGIRSVFFAVATSEIKPEIASVYLYSDQEKLYFVGTDSFRLAEKKYNVKGLPDTIKILIPFKSISDILRTLDIFPDTITMTFSRNQLSLVGGGVYFTTRLIDGGFPAYQTIIPKESKTTITILRQELLQTLRLSAAFTDTFSHITLLIDPKKKEVFFQSKNAAVGSSETIIDTVITGEPIEVVFNLKYFIDVFQALDGDSVTLSLIEPHKPILIKSTQDQNFLYLLMPTNR